MQMAASCILFASPWTPLFIPFMLQPTLIITVSHSPISTTRRTRNCLDDWHLPLFPLQYIKSCNQCRIALPTPEIPYRCRSESLEHSLHACSCSFITHS